MIFMDHTELLIEADNNHLITKKKPLVAYDGRIKGNKIAIKNALTTTEKMRSCGKIRTLLCNGREYICCINNV